MISSVLIFGGRSDERLVSVASGQNLASKYPFAELWFLHETGAVSRTTKEELAAHTKPFENPFVPAQAPFATNLEVALASLQRLPQPSALFLALHGTEGEDGTLQRVFEEKNIAFTGSGSVSSHNCFDKIRAKEIVREKGVPLAAGLAYKKTGASDEANTLEKILNDFISEHGKIVVKPVESGSSIGLHILSSKDEVRPAVKAILLSPYATYLTEAFIEGRELTVGVMEENGKLNFLPPSEVVLNAGHSFDYQGKYLGRGTTEITPALLTEEEKNLAGDLAIRSHEALGCFGYSRTDMILTKRGPIFLETNTLPGLSRASFIPQQLAAQGYDIKNFIDLQLALGLKRTL